MGGDHDYDDIEQTVQNLCSQHPNKVIIVCQGNSLERGKFEGFIYPVFSFFPNFATCGVKEKVQREGERDADVANHASHHLRRLIQQKDGREGHWRNGLIYFTP